jgi:hypothetical protein
MEIKRIERIQSQRLYYPRAFRNLVWVLYLSLLVNLFLVVVLLFWFFTWPEPAYYANSFDGLITPMTMITRPTPTDN